MDLETLKKSHPDVYAAAVQVGLAQERDRVCAHLELGEQCAAMTIAVNAIKDGTAMNQTLTAKYIGAGLNRADRNVRQTETEAAAAVTAGAAVTATPSADLGDLVVAALESHRTDVA